MRTKKEIGDHYEHSARQYLEKKGLVFIAKNQRFKTGELDLIMKDGACFVFIEVKFRQNTFYGGAIGSISSKKKQRLLQAAYLWLKKHHHSGTHTQFRFDAVIIEGKIDNTLWVKNILVEG